MRASPRLIRFALFSLISVLAVGALTMAVTFYFRADLLRWHYMGLICAEDEAQRQRGVSYLARHIGEPEVIDKARRMLRDADDVCFDRIVQGLSIAGAWGPNFDDAWRRYLLNRLDQAVPIQRSAIAVDLGKTLWREPSVGSEPRIHAAIEKLLKDPDPSVRLNALSAAALVPGAAAELIQPLTDDSVGVIAQHARILLHLLQPAQHPLPQLAGPPPGPAADAPPELKRLAELEALPTNSVDLPITTDMPLMIRLQAVRVSRQATPADLMLIFGQGQAPLRDLACIVALQRFSPEQCRQLAYELLADFGNNERMAGAILTGLTGGDDRTRPLLARRIREAEDWVAQQHFLLGSWLLGDKPADFDPLRLLLIDKMPRTTVTLALLRRGRLEGLDWMLNPFGNPPIPLTLMFDSLRYIHVLRPSLPQLPEFWFWADLPTQKMQVDVIRDWYLLQRPHLRFDEATGVFRHPAIAAPPLP